VRISRRHYGTWILNTYGIRKKAAAWLIEMDIEPEHGTGVAFFACSVVSAPHRGFSIKPRCGWNSRGSILATLMMIRVDYSTTPARSSMPRTAEKREQASGGVKYHSWFTRLVVCHGLAYL
jgi:hypothetical protein